ncbi:MAG: ATP-binding protein [Lachnospiraceae bacterium]|nr:ATP-binding protein [Lachnospiraceae bacterium]
MGTFELTDKATLENLEIVNAFLEEHLGEAGCPFKDQMQIVVVAEEIYVNIAHYAYFPETGMFTLKLEIREDPCEAELTFIDSGMPFNPLEMEDPDITLPAEERDVGGLGILMMKKMMDSISYENTDGHNILKVIKKFRKASLDGWF